MLFSENIDPEEGSEKLNTEANTSVESSNKLEENLVSEPNIADESNTDIPDEKISENIEGNIETDSGNTGDVSLNDDDSEVDHEEHHYEDEADLIENIDISSLGKIELIAFLESMSENPKLNIIRDYLHEAKDKFDSILLEEKKQALAKWIEGGGVEEDFKPKPDPDKSTFYRAYKKVGKIKHDIISKRNDEKSSNLKIKKDLLSRMKDIIQNENDIPKAFHEFHDIQEKWREVGPVPGSDVKDLWMTYKLYVDKFYDLIKINRELQKLDQNKNLEIKMNFCEQMEDLLTEKDMHKVMLRTRSLQNRWRTIGPVPRDKNEEIWNRFKAAIERLNDRKAKHEGELKERYENNLVMKTQLCEKAEVLSAFESDKHNLWQNKIKELLELQSEWKKAGPVAKEQNETIWLRFRNACSEFFKKKNEFYQGRKNEQKAAIQTKTELCIEAEALQDSEDWRQTSMEFKKLQNKWKESGRIPDKKSKELWSRFKAAGDKFFNRKGEHSAGFEKEQVENLKLKLALVESIEKYTPSENANESLNQLKQFQREWTNIGLVPFKSKNDIQKKFRSAIDKHFDALNIDEVEKEKIRFSQKVNSLKQSSDSFHKIKSERFHISKKLNALQSEVNVWENNIGFFSHSKNAQDMKKEFEEKIEKAKQEISILQEKLILLKQV